MEFSKAVVKIRFGFQLERCNSKKEIPLRSCCWCIHPIFLWLQKLDRRNVCDSNHQESHWTTFLIGFTAEKKNRIFFQWISFESINMNGHTKIVKLTDIVSYKKVDSHLSTWKLRWRMRYKTHLACFKWFPFVSDTRCTEQNRTARAHYNHTFHTVGNPGSWLILLHT